MKKIYLVVVFLTFVGSFLGCKQPEVEIVEFNDSYTLDKNVISVEMPKKFVYDSSNIVKVEGNIEACLFAEVKDGVSNVDSKTIDIRFRLRKPMDKPVKLRIREDRALLSKYPDPDTIEEYQPFPKGSLKEYDIVIPAGKVIHDAQIELDDATKFVDDAGYLTALGVSLVEEDLAIALSKNNSVFFVKVEVLPNLINEDNVHVSDRQLSKNPVRNAVYSSNFRPDLVPLLEKDNYRTVWWVQEGSDSYLEIKFDMTLVTSGKMKCNLNSKSKTIKKVKIEVSNDGGVTFVEQGYLEVPKAGWYTYFVFDTPQEINAIRFSEFETYSTDPKDRYVDFCNISIFQ
ncbi:hypothetical protein IX335_001497 [Porphyromonas levii]|uniref:DUF1735 domain-containing protein n=1 Tax=Porphyromonas levii TaxID=28114 RepID=UPI001BA9E6AB|nr:DUF1735 domain-containing protein [Porphyromonas levii]MBR8764269.1 hypothetical protein [Porphyromonas levii]